MAPGGDGRGSRSHRHHSTFSHFFWRQFSWSAAPRGRAGRLHHEHDVQLSDPSETEETENSRHGSWGGRAGVLSPHTSCSHLPFSFAAISVGRCWQKRKWAAPA